MPTQDRQDSKIHTLTKNRAKIHTPIPNLKLSDGTSIPMLSYGTGTAWYKTGDESKIDRALIDSIKTAVNIGYTHLDGAEVYKTEPELGTAIKESGKKRDELYVVTKVSPNIADIPAALKASLGKLGLDYVDLFALLSIFPNIVLTQPATSSTSPSSPNPTPASRPPGKQWNQ